MSSGTDLPVIFPSSDSTSRRLPFLHRVPWVGSPASAVCETLRLPAARPASLRFLRSAVPSWCSRFAPTQGEHQRALARTLFSRSPNRVFRRRRQGLPGSLTDLGAYMPLLFDPGGAVQPSQNDCTMLPSAVSTTSASSKWSFRGSIAAAYTLAVYASQCRLPGRHARLASGRWLVPLPGGVDVRLPAAPPGPIRRVSVTMLLHHASPLPGLSLAQRDLTPSVIASMIQNIPRDASGS